MARAWAAISLSRASRRLADLARAEGLHHPRWLVVHQVDADVGVKQVAGFVVQSASRSCCSSCSRPAERKEGEKEASAANAPVIGRPAGGDAQLIALALDLQLQIVAFISELSRDAPGLGVAIAEGSSGRTETAAGRHLAKWPTRMTANCLWPYSGYAFQAP